MNVETNDLNAILAKLRAEGKRIASISVGERNGDWIVCTVELTLRQAALGLVSADGGYRAPERGILARVGRSAENSIRH